MMKTWWGALVGVLVVVGCGPSSFSSRDEAERSPYCLKARKAVEQRDFERAVELYQKALVVNPELADAHMELGLLYEDKRKDPIAAIYHYRRYVELRPHSSKTQVVQDFIERAKVTLLTSLPQSAMLDADVNARMQEEKTNLAQENAMLRARVTELEAALEEGAAAEILRADARAAASPAAVEAPVTPVVALNPSEPTAAGRTHLVQKGDTLYSLAQRYYGNRSEWQRIFQANRHALASKDQLKIGQQLLIP